MLTRRQFEDQANDMVGRATSRFEPQAVLGYQYANPEFAQMAARELSARLTKVNLGFRTQFGSDGNSVLVHVIDDRSYTRTLDILGARPDFEATYSTDGSKLRDLSPT
jgi:gentisate 1,2-dioxygenase